MTGRRLNAAGLLELLERAVAEKGADHVYSKDTGTCRYFGAEDGEPACIFGHVLGYLGLGPEDVIEGEPIEILLFESGLVLDIRVRQLASQVQAGQDRGHPWGSVVENFRTATQDLTDVV